MQITQCNQITMPANKEDEICAVYRKRVENIYAAHQLTLAKDHWDKQGKYQYIELAHAIIQHQDNLKHLNKSQRIVFIYMSPEFKANTHLGPAIQHHYQLNCHCHDLIDCHTHALSYALLISLYKPAHLRHLAIIYLEQALSDRFSATPHQTTSNSAGMLCLSDNHTHMMQGSHHLAAVYTGRSLHAITQQQPHLQRLHGVTVITNHTTIEERLQNNPPIDRVFLCLSAGFSAIFLYLSKSLTMRPRCKHIWIILSNFIDHSTTMIWIKQC